MIGFKSYKNTSDDDRNTVRIAGTDYRWSGWFGIQLESYERHRYANGDMRHILGRDFLAFRVERVNHGWFGVRYRVGWAMTGIPANAVETANAAIKALRQEIKEMAV